MLNLVFGILMLVIFGKLLVFALSATWGIARIFFSLVLLPLFLEVLFINGLVLIAFPVLLVIGLISLFTPAR